MQPCGASNVVPPAPTTIADPSHTRSNSLKREITGVRRAGTAERAKSSDAEVRGAGRPRQGWCPRGESAFGGIGERGERRGGRARGASG